MTQPAPNLPVLLLKSDVLREHLVSPQLLARNFLWHAS
jgi:hypothetical protein